jgi:hypothetical protein
MNIEVPMHTVLKFTPSRGGGWVESRHDLIPEEDIHVDAREKIYSIASESELSALSYVEQVASSPIWGDHVPTSPVSHKVVR